MLLRNFLYLEMRHAYTIQVKQVIGHQIYKENPYPIPSNKYVVQKKSDCHEYNWMRKKHDHNNEKNNI